MVCIVCKSRSYEKIDDQENYERLTYGCSLGFLSHFGAPGLFNEFCSPTEALFDSSVTGTLHEVRFCLLRCKVIRGLPGAVAVLYGFRLRAFAVLFSSIEHKHSNEFKLGRILIRLRRLQTDHTLPTFKLARIARKSSLIKLKNQCSCQCSCQCFDLIICFCL